MKERSATLNIVVGAILVVLAILNFTLWDNKTLGIIAAGLGIILLSIGMRKSGSTLKQ